jgi:cytochrome c
VLAASFLLATSALAADERATPQDAEELVKTASTYLKKHGAEKAYKEFQNKNGPFIYKDLYVMVYDMGGKCLAHGADPAKVGKDLIDQKDANGKAYTRERLSIAKEKGKGWQEYVYKNPATSKVEPKVVYFEKVGEVVVSAGAYKP